MVATLFRRSSAREIDRRRAFIEGYAFPPALRDALGTEFDPPLTPQQSSTALEGLRVWFLACLHANGKLLGMPSEAVDLAWHEFILHTRSYSAFCEEAFGAYLHHTPAGEMREPMEDALRRTLKVVTHHPTAHDLGRDVPFLFAVDELVGLEGGTVWTEDDIERLRQGRRGDGSAGSGCGSNCGGDGGCGGGCGGG